MKSVWNGNIKAMPDSDDESVPNTTSQKTIFWPALNFLACTCEPSPNSPPPFNSHTTSLGPGMLWTTHCTKASATPIMKAKAT